MDGSVIVGIDVGTTKICALVGRIEEHDRLRILGVGVEPSRGIRKGAVVDLVGVAQAIRHAVDKAENHLWGWRSNPPWSSWLAHRFPR